MMTEALADHDLLNKQEALHGNLSGHSTLFQCATCWPTDSSHTKIQPDRFIVYFIKCSGNSLSYVEKFVLSEWTHHAVLWLDTLVANLNTDVFGQKSERFLVWSLRLLNYQIFFLFELSLAKTYRLFLLPASCSICSSNQLQDIKW